MAKSEIRYRPCASLVADWVAPVPTFVARTVVPGTTAPDVSVTVPKIVPVANCAARGTHVTPINSAAHAAITNTLRSFKALDISHLSCLQFAGSREPVTDRPRCSARYRSDAYPVCYSCTIAAYSCQTYFHLCALMVRFGR